MFNFNQNKRNRSGVRGKGKKNLPKEVKEEEKAGSAEKQKKPFKSPSAGAKKGGKKKKGA